MLAQLIFNLNNIIWMIPDGVTDYVNDTVNTCTSTFRVFGRVDLCIDEWICT